VVVKGEGGTWLLVAAVGAFILYHERGPRGLGCRLSGDGCLRGDDPQHDAGADTAGMGDAVTTADALGDATGLGDGTIGEAGLPTTAPWLPTVHSPRALPRSILAMLGSRTTLLMCGLRMLKRARWLP